MSHAFPKWMLITLLSAALLLFCGCSRNADVSNVLDAALTSQQSIPDGRIYISSLPEDDPAHLGEELSAILWGNGSPHPAYALTSSAAVFIPTRNEPFEMAVLECVSTDSAADVALMCCERAGVLTKAYQITDDLFSVSVYGRYVVFTLCPSPETAQKAAQHAISHPKNSSTTQ